MNRLKSFLICLYCLASFEFIHFYVETTQLWVDLPRYLSGTERLPYQTRILPAVFLWPAAHAHDLLRWITGYGWTLHAADARLAAGAWFVWSLLAFLMASLYCVKLYRAVEPNGRAEALVLFAFFSISVASFTMHSFRNLSYPYDFSALAFMTAGIYYVYQRRFFALCVVLLLGTLNRETVVFLIAIFAIDAAWKKRSLTALPLRKVATLCAVWLIVHAATAHAFAHNDASETFSRFAVNFADLFSSYQRSEVVLTAAVPTAPKRTGDFSQSGRNIYNPLTTAGTGTPATRQKFAGSRIPVLNPIGAALANY